ncbi:ABC transporter substrate-binding protein [Verminephrobacter aporrectodeae]|uniref:ABC transporter permease n=1 Tax=Verminephrobacter aporrectodeae subsp. tuberculatae TaxID=1110392 RepID=A0ABT3KQQ0_9BURK|nr:ABC transporter substrate-binding protein [Verminephrobacter aporrectodeae]MCW5220935.1 ABC transporter permease [Verminephrobacter aporrectodeae subsp. tuberculatae]MCW5290229.1 ABC transporter permease [Verminephrobacter aporrectodeae subsp. tuberculatae]MCW5320120.1 ABC transporter permease [Verminephrobacter aporrectodeae subsp. tuberculatae]MCW8164140.1 ABC transporter permease [Verminephrobacter aporrectodeae subsp. tuberculatae]MCW8170572.1 ABC transporter permease [Verminephrobacter
MKRLLVKWAPLAAAAACTLGLATAVRAQDGPGTKVVLGMSGWTGFAPLTLADKAGIFKKNGLDVEIKLIPQKDRHFALASKSIQCAATTVETHVAWNANGVPIVQIFQTDKSYGADGLAVRDGIKGFADLRGKTIGVDAPGTAPYFGLAWMLSKNGMRLKDVKLTTLSPQAAAQAFVAGQNDAAMTYEPYLSTVRENPGAGKILATTLDYPMVIDTVGCAPAWLKEHPKAAQALADSYFAALDLIAADPARSNEIMGAAVKQTGEQFAKSASFLRWQDRAANQKFFTEEISAFMKDATAILLEAGVIRKAPQDLAAMFDARFVK